MQSILNIINEMSKKNQIDHARVRYLILSELKKHNAISQGELVRTLEKNDELSVLTKKYAITNKEKEKFYKMIASNEQRLQAAGLEEFTKNGHRITQQGLDLIMNLKTNRITYEDLRLYEKFTVWEKRLGISPKKVEEIVDNSSILVAPNYHDLSDFTESTQPQFDDDALFSILLEVTENFSKSEWYYRVSEENVRAEIVEPILKAIGWSSPFLRREAKNMDYLLCNDEFFSPNSRKIVVEVKKYCEQLRSNGGIKKGMGYKNQNQLLEYCGDTDVAPVLGILTNGIRWCLYCSIDNEYKYKGEIDIREKSCWDDICRFFWAISKNEINKIGQTNWDWIKEGKEEKRPTIIRIKDNNVEEVFYSRKSGHNHGDACFKVGKLFVDKCVKMKKPYNDPYQYEFIDKILVDKKCINKNSPYLYVREEEKYEINIDNDFYVKVALLQEINSTFSLGLSITTG